MNKLLKLTGVSVVAIMTAMGANAAGYTCEELIEYTSCNTGYALLEGDCVCDGGYYTNGDKCTICPIGTYSSVNASECTTCPTTGLVDPNNNAIVATTASTGSKNISACIIPTNVTIKGETGLYHFRSSCKYDDTALFYEPAEGQGCDKGYTLINTVSDTTYERICYQFTKSWCEDYMAQDVAPSDMIDQLYWDDDANTCVCDDGFGWVFNVESERPECFW